MKNGQTWLIGANAKCDLIFDVPSVSRIHCQIKKEGKGYLLTDSNSTNGTFVNDVQIKEPTKVTPQDEIRFGKLALFPWKLLRERSPMRIFRIGRSPHNDIVIDDPSVSTNHAQIVMHGQRTFIQDLGSTNGIAVDNPHNKIDSIELLPTTIVYFGTCTETGENLLKKTMSLSDHINQFWKDNWTNHFSEKEKISLIAFTVAVAILLISIVGFMFF